MATALRRPAATLTGWRTALAGVLVIALALRLVGVDWDGGRLLNPDERQMVAIAQAARWPPSVDEYFDTSRSRLNPANVEPGKSYADGTLPLFAVKGAAAALGVHADKDIILLGRVLTALLGVGTVLLVFLSGSLVLGRGGGLLAAVLAGMTVLPVQLAHFWIVDPWVAFFTAATLLLSLTAWRDGRRRWLVGAGAALGLAIACRYSAVTLAVLPVAAVLLRRRTHDGERASLDDGARAIPALVASALVALLVVRVAQPYAFEGPHPWNLRLDHHFLDAIREQRRLLGGDATWPPAVFWAGRPRLLYPAQNLLGWGLGPALGLACLAALGLAARRLLHGRDLWVVLPLACITAVVLAHGLEFVAYTRFLLPAIPALCLLAAWALGQAASSGTPGRAVAAGVLAATACWTVAFMSIYVREHPLIAASAWIDDHVPAQAAIAVDAGDDALPLAGDGRPARPPAVTLPLLDADSTGKVDQLVSGLEQARWIVASSDRVRSAARRLPNVYPATLRYYRGLEDGTLGFRRRVRFTGTPSLLGVPMPSLGAEQTLSLYDHPTIDIYEKTAAFDATRVRDALMAPDVGRVPPGPPARALEPRAVQGRDEAARQQAGGTWRDRFSADGRGPLGLPAVVMWLLALELCTLAALPLVTPALRALPDRGLALGKPLGLLAVAYPAWLGASLNLWSFSAGALIACAAAVGAAGALVAWRRRTRVAAAVRARWRQALAVEGVFLAAFLAIYALRTGNPDLFHPYRGGEKPMDLAHLTAVMKSTSLPPYDPWFAGGYLNYYYFGHVLVAAVAVPLRVPPEIAYNLAVPMFAAFIAVAAYGLAFDLAALTIRHRRATHAPTRGAPAVAGIMAVAVVLVLGNLDGAVQWVEHLRSADPGPFDYWRASRIIHNSFSVTEFPAFTVLLADLHAHLMAMPYAMACTGASLAVLCATAARGSARAALAPLVLTGLLLGMVRATNTWDFPTQAVLAGLAAGTGMWLAHGRRDRAWLRGTAASIALMFAVCWIAFLPFTSRFHTVATLTGAVEATPLGAFVLHFGLLLLLCAGLLAAGARGRTWPVRSMPWGAMLSVAVLAAVAWELSGRLTLLVLVGAAGLLAGAWARAARAGRDAGLLAAIGLALTGIAVAAGVEIAQVQPDLERMNTVFKFWLQTWWLLAVAGAYAGWRGLTLRRGAGPLRTAWTVLAAVGACAALIYPLAAVPARLRERIVHTPATVNGMAYMSAARYQDDHGSYRLGSDLAVIRWIRGHVRGSPPIIEAVTPLYRWGSRMSIYTGLPAVIGWDYHEKQQRYARQEDVDRRLADVATFYATRDPGRAHAILRRYGVRYVVVGELERAYYPATGIAKIPHVPGLRRVFAGDGAQLYERTDGGL